MALKKTTREVENHKEEVGMPAKEFFMKTISCGCLPQSVHPVFFVQKYFLCMTRISLLLPVNMFPNLLTKVFQIKLS